MPEYRKPDYKNFNGPKKPFNKFGPSRPGMDRPKQMFRAECSNCGGSCEVPFRPNGMKPVFCSNCFQRAERDSGQDTRGSYPRHDAGSARAFAPKPAQDDRRFEDLKRQIAALDAKLDALVDLLDTTRSYAPMPAEEAPLKPAKKAAPKAKAAPKKAPAKKAKPVKK